MHKLTLFITLGLTFIVLIGVICWALPVQTVQSIQNVHTQIPTFRELQQQLVDLGYDIEVDGRIGKKTISAWEKEICNQHAIKAFERWAKK